LKKEKECKTEYRIGTKMRPTEKRREEKRREEKRREEKKFSGSCSRM